MVSPQSDAEPGDLEAQAEQLWREVAAAQATYGAAEAAAVVEAEAKTEVRAEASTQMTSPLWRHRQKQR